MKGKMIILKAARPRNKKGYNIIDIEGNDNLFTDTIKEEIGGWMEAVYPKGLKYPYIMVVDEEGRVKDKPTNVIGSMLYNYNNTGFKPIVGDVVIIKLVNGEEGPEFALLNEEDVENVTKMLTDIISLYL